MSITGVGSSLTNATILLNVSFDSDMQVDFDDIRFIDNACDETQDTEIVYYPIKVIDSNSALFKVKVPTLDSGELSDDVCMYYDNDGASSTKDGNLIYDDLVVYYPFDEGSGTNVASTTGADACTLSTDAGWIVSPMGYAFDFDSDATANCGSSVNLDNAFGGDTTGDYTYAFRSATNGVPSGDRHFITKGTSSASVFSFMYSLETIRIIRIQGGVQSTINFEKSISGWKSNAFTMAGRTFADVTGYQNGTLSTKVDNVDTLNVDLSNTGNDLTINTIPWVGNEDPILDEIIVVNAIWSANRVLREHQNSNFSKFSFGAEEEDADTIPPYFTNNTPQNQTITYGIAFNYIINATDETEFGCFEVNDTTNFQINCSGYLQNNTLLASALYNLNVTINDTANNLNSSYFWVNVTKGNPSINMAISGTTPIEFGITSDFSESETNPGDGGCSYSLDLSNGIFGVGTWTFNYSTASCNNYTSGSITKDLVVNKNTSLILGLTATTPIEYPATTDFTGSDCPTQLSCALNISNAIYRAGDISANYSTAGNNNYSATSSEFTVTINQNSSYILGISGTTPITYGTITDVIGSNCPAQLSCALDKANDIYGVGVSPLTFNYSTVGNVNFTANSITKDITINQAGDTFITLLNNIVSNLTVTFPQQVNVSISNNLTIATIDVNGTTLINANNYTLGANIWFVNVSTSGNNNYTANESNWYITVNQAVPTGTLAGTSPITYGTIGNVIGTESNPGDGDLVYRLLRDETIVSNPDATVLGVGTYNYIYNVTGGQNYSTVSSLDTFALTVDIETGDGTLLLNGSATNYSINRTAHVNITATLDTGSGDISVYIDTTLFDSGSSPISDQEQFNTTGFFLVNFTYPGNQNYTGFEKYLYINVTANPLAIVNIVYPTAGEYEVNFIALNYTISYAVNCWYNLGIGGGYVGITCGDNVTGITSVEGNNVWIVKAENFDGINVTDSVSFTIDLPIEYSVFTLGMVDVIKIFIMFVGLFIIVMAAKSFYAGGMTFGRLFTIGVIVSLGVGGVILLAPILIRYISDLIS